MGNVKKALREAMRECFVREYSENGQNATAAAAAAGYSTPAVAGCKILKQPAVQKKLNEIRKAAEAAKLAEENENRRAVNEGALELARKSFWNYCKIKAPNFYKPERKYLENLCENLQKFYESTGRILSVSLPPRHGKSRTAACFAEWILGKNRDEKIMTGSYNERLSRSFARTVRNTISEKKADLTKIVYSDIFPDTKIKKGDASVNLWSLEGSFNNYLATSPNGTATGFGATLIIVDDLIKSSYEAHNAVILENHREWFFNTMMSRLEKNGKVIVIMTRWHSNDLAGVIMREFPDAGKIVMQAKQADGTMLCSDILDQKDYEFKIRTMGADIASSNYQQEPIDIKGRLYGDFKTYEKVPEFEAVKSYTDTADAGADYLCSIVFGVYKKQAYILDVLYTKEDMSVTEQKQAEMLDKNGVNVAVIESNNGGVGFARSVREKIKGRTVIKTITQTKNKTARILSNSSWITENVYFPANWRDKWREFYTALYEYQREGRNKHDDAPDALTGVAESIINVNEIRFV